MFLRLSSGNTLSSFAGKPSSPELFFGFKLNIMRLILKIFKKYTEIYFRFVRIVA